MTIVLTELEKYLVEGEGYMEGSYLATMFQGAMGMQADVQIVSAQKPLGMQADRTVGNIDDATGMQSDIQITDALSELAMEAFRTTLTHIIHESYLNSGGYLEDAYLTTVICAIMGMESDRFIIDFENALGMQADIQISDTENELGMQSDIQIVDFEEALGMEALRVIAEGIGMQANISVYNTRNLRILCEFPSRGTTDGDNWTASTQAAGDFLPSNLNTDILEQVWRGADGDLTSVTLTADTELVQGVRVDTVAILNHNITTSGQVTLLGSDDPTFGTIGVTIPMQVTAERMYFIADALPLEGFRYWRFLIDDAGNPDNFIEIGTIIFGPAVVFQGECFVDQVEFGENDFADSVPTEGFTNTSNSRALRRGLGLQFRSLRAERRNFQLLREIFRDFRTTTKCLWIPTPSATDQDITDQFAVFSKLRVLPRAVHNSKGPNLTFVSFPLEWDESQ